MPKSKYPQNLDTSIEIPPVRDNILEVGSEVINSLRSAMFNIERTLGINPQGAVGNTVSSRLDKSLDLNGNIKSDALQQSNLLTGPVLDADVSSVAAIRETKLKLDFPTSLLQSEISTLNLQLDTILEQVDELTISLSGHLNSNALNRHPATAIGVSAHTSIESDTAGLNITSGTVQDTFESLYDDHINYSGNNISEINRSHEANQIYFDNANISEIIISDDVQGAVEDVVSAALGAQIAHQDLFHSNGLLKTDKIDSAKNNNVGNILAEGISISFVKNSGGSNNTTVVTINDTVTIGDFQLERSDILTISDASNSSLDGDYQIEDFVISSGDLTTLVIYGTFPDNSTSLTLGKISKNINQDTNILSLIASVREEAGLTSARSIQICNPNSVKVISEGIRPSEVTAINRLITVALDGGASVTIDLFDPSKTRQTLDSIVSRINEQCADNAYTFLSYRVNAELAIAHNLPDDETTQHTITIGRSTDSGIDAAGFTSIEDQEISSDFGSSYLIQGDLSEGLREVIDSQSLNFFQNSNAINTSVSGIDFLEIGIKRGDLVSISNSPSDDGSYIVQSVTATQIDLDLNQLPSGFTASSDSDTRVQVFSNIISLQDITFDEVSATFGSMLVDVFMDSNRNLFFDKRLEYTPELLGTTSLFEVTNFEGDVADKQFELSIESGTGLVTASLDEGPAVEVRGSNSYVRLTSGNYNVVIEFLIPSIDDINTKIGATTIPVSGIIFGFQGANDEENLLISRLTYNNFQGRIVGGLSAPRIFSILERGNVGLNQVATSAIRELSEVSVNELRSNGAVYGLELFNVTLTGDLYTFDIERGVCYVLGKRIEVDEITTLITDLDSTSIDKIFVAINADGEIMFEGATSTCASPFSDSEFCIIASLEFNGTTVSYIDARLFIDELDLKLLNSVNVSPTKGMGHFDSVSKAVKYTKRFAELYPNSGRPSIHLKSGTHETIVEVDLTSQTFAQWVADFISDSSTALTPIFDANIESGIALDFPVDIIGEGDNSILKLRTSAQFSDVTYELRGFILIPGDGFTSHTNTLDKITEGFISLKNFRLDNTRVELLDLNLDDGVGTDYTFGVNLDSLIFDFENLTSNPFDTQIGPLAVRFVEQDNSVRNKGNVSIDNCSFIQCNITTPNPIRVKNLNVSFNKIYNDDNLVLLEQDVYTFTSADNGSNITIFGNHNFANFNTVGATGEPEIVSGTRWGDRLSRDLRVGGNTFLENLSVSGTADISGSVNFSGSVSADDFSYTSTKTKTVFYLFDRLNSGSGSIMPWASIFSSPLHATESIADGGLTDFINWPIISFPTSSHNFRLKFDFAAGETLESVRLGTLVADSATWSISVERLRFGGGSTSLTVFELLEGPFASISTSGLPPSTQLQAVNFADTYSTTAFNGQSYYLNITQDDTGNKLFWVEVTTGINTVSEGLGVT